MPKPLPDGLPRGRYDYVAVCDEIRRVLKREGRGSYKTAAAACKLKATAFSQRLRGKESRFELEHLGALADRFDAPPGWPLVPWEVGEEMEHARREKRTGRGRGG
jgi:hypothetical protein